MTAQPVRIHADDSMLDADLAVPSGAASVILFAHGSGSSRHSPRNQHVAAALNDAGFATVLMDLLTPKEDEIDRQTRELRFDIPRLARRLTVAVDWLADHSVTSTMPVFLFGASTGAAAALISAADRPGRVHGVVSRGGRTDLAGEALGRVRCPVLLIAGGEDLVVRRLDAETARTLRTTGIEVDEVVIPGATHLFEEPGALDAVVEVTLDRLRGWQPG